MATIIDAFVVTLGLDPAKYKTGSADARKDMGKTADAARKSAGDQTASQRRQSVEATRAAKEREAAGARVAQSISKVRNEVLALAGLFTAGVGIKDFITSTIGGAAAASRMGADLDMSARDLIAWQRAAEKAGGSADGITAQLKESQSAVASFNLGQATAATLQFFRFGGHQEDLKDGNTFLLARAKIVAEIYKTDKARAQVVAGAIGLDAGQFDFIKQGDQGIQSSVGQQLKTDHLTDDQARKAEELREKWLDLRNTFTDTGTQIAVALIPALERVSGYFQQFATWAETHQGAIVAFVDASVTAIGKLATEADHVADAMGGWQNVLLAIGAIKLLSLTTDALGLGTAIVGIIGGLKVLVRASSAAGAALGRALGLGGKAELASEVAAEDAAGAGAEGAAAGAEGVGVEAAAAGSEGAAVNAAWAEGAGVAGEAGAAGVAGAEGIAGAAGAAGIGAAEVTGGIGLGALIAPVAAIAGMLYSPGTNQGEQATLAASDPKTQAVVGQLMKKGWSREQASGIAANLYAESGLQAHGPDGDSGQATGIAQWHPDRQAAFKRQYGLELRDASLEQQVDFVDFELRQGTRKAAGTKLAATTKAGDAGEEVSRHYEAPKNADGEAARRRELADAIFRMSARNSAAASAAMPVGASIAAPVPAPSSGPVSSTSTTDVTIGTITVHTQATDAKGVAGAIGPAVRRYSFASQANSGIA